MSENDELARRLAQEQARADQEALDEVTQKVEAGFRLATQEEQQRQAARREQDKRNHGTQQQAQEQEAAAKSAQEYEAENLKKAQEAGKDIAGNPEEQSFGYANNFQATGSSYTIGSDTNQDDTVMPTYTGAAMQEGDQTTVNSADMNAQTDTYDFNAQNAVYETQESKEMSENQETGLQVVRNAAVRNNENLNIGPYSEARTSDAYDAQTQGANAAVQQEAAYDANDPFAAWHAENQMRSATFDMNQSEQAMFDEQLNRQTPDSYSVGSSEAAMMGSFTQDLSDDDRVLYKSIRTANTDEYGPVKVGPQAATQTANTQAGTTPAKANDDGKDNRIYVNDQTFASRFEDTVFWKSDERKKAWEQFVNAFKNAKTLESLIEDGFFAALEVGLDMINAYMDWEKAEAKKLAGFVKESKKSYDADNDKANGISPQEGYKRTHDAIHASKDLWKALEQQKFYGDLPKNEWGGIDLKNCTNKQKAMLGEFQVRFAQSSPEFKKILEEMRGREYNAEDIALAAESMRNTLYGFEDGPKRANGTENMQRPFGNGPTGPRQSGPDMPAPTPGKPTPQGPTLSPEASRSASPEMPLLNNTPTQTIVPPNRTLGNTTLNALENKDTPNVYKMDPLFQEKKPDVIDGRTGEVLDGIEIPDKETMRNVTPPKGPLKNARPAEFGDLNRRASDNIRDMHDTADAMRQNRFNARLIEASRNGRTPPQGRGPDRMLGNNFGRDAA